MSNNDPLKIVYLIPGGLFNPGGMERITILKANYLAEKMGYDVSIVTTEQMGRPVFFPVSEKVSLCHLDIAIHAKFGKEKYIEKVISRFLKTRKYVRELKKLLNKMRPDITVSLLGLDIEFLNDFRDGSIKIGELHFPANFRQLMTRKLSSTFIPNWVAAVRTQTFKRACRKLSRLVVLTNEEKASWKGANNIEVIPNALSFFPETVADYEQKKAIAVGRLVYEKGFDMLIEAWKAVYEKHPDWELHIYGDGNEKENLCRLIRQTGLDSVVSIHAPEKDIYSQYPKHSMLLFPSRYLEALPMVLIESMSCGLPLVAFDAPCGPKDVIKDGVNGFLVKTGDIDVLSAKINDLIELEGMRETMGKAAREMSFDYGEEKIMKRWLLLFETVINNK
jgi:glycosyltransferase involved in cell wall biosynthesis